MAFDAAEILTPTIVNGLPTDWRWKRLDSVCEGVFDCPHSTPILTQDGPFIARSQDMRSGVFRTGEAGHVSHETYRERIVRAEPRYSDLLYSREGTYFGIAAEVPRGIQVCLGQRMVLLRPCANGVNFRFLRYWLNSPVMSMYAHGFRDGTVAERLNLPTIRALPIAVPPLPEQRAIAHILGTLDDKIELNRRMNETLEAMARTIFKSWFVDFLPVRAKAAARTQTSDPVRAKAEGRDPGLPKHIADLFPDRFEYSELGEIPAGWKVNTFADTVEIIGGGTPKTSVAEYWDGDIPWFSVVDAPNGADVWVVETEKKITKQGLENCSTRVLPVGTTIITARGTVGRIALVGVPMAMNQSCYGLRGKFGSQGLFNYFATREIVVTLQQRVHGSVFDTITRDTLGGVQVANPLPKVVEAFESQVSPILRRVLECLLETRNLAVLRDTLLPKLISGELRVKDAERFIGKVA